MEKVRFAVMTDLHSDSIPDGAERLDIFLRRARTENVDFIVQLGDFCSPSTENRRLIDAFNSFEKPHYHLMGNHDAKFRNAGTIEQWLGTASSSYAFSQGGVRFIALDSSHTASLPDDQLNWLDSEIMHSDQPIIILSHHSIENTFRNRGISNGDMIRGLIRKHNQRGKRVLACINGHDHTDSVEIADGIYYITINSISCKWFGFTNLAVGAAVKKRHPEIGDLVLHQNPLSAIISIHESNDIELRGMHGDYQSGFLPSDFGIVSWDGRRVCAGIEDRYLHHTRRTTCCESTQDETTSSPPR